MILQLAVILTPTSILMPQPRLNVLNPHADPDPKPDLSSNFNLPSPHRSSRTAGSAPTWGPTSGLG